jgi:hypothetical protein
MRAWLSATAACCCAPVALAHHSNAQFDTSEVVTFEATVTRFEWKNPHVFIQVEARNDTGERVEIQVEGDGTPVLMPLGWSRDSLQVGDVVTVSASPARDSRRRAVLGREIITPDGRVLTPNPEFLPVASPESTHTATGLDGVWLPRHEDFFAYLRSVNDWSLTAKGQAYLDAYDGTQNPQADCIPVSSPVIMVYMVHTEIETLDDRVVIRSDWMNVERVVYTDGRGHPQDGVRTPQGHSIGHWDGDALVIDTTLFNEHSGGLVVGVPSGLDKHITERLSLGEDRSSLNYEFVLEDPEYLRAPVRGSAVWTYRPDLVPAASDCDIEAAQRFLRSDP